MPQAPLDPPLRASNELVFPAYDPLLDSRKLCRQVARAVLKTVVFVLLLDAFIAHFTVGWPLFPGLRF